MSDSLDNPIWSSLVGDHARVARRQGRAARYLPDVLPIGALEQPDEKALRDLAALVAPGEAIWVQHVRPQHAGPQWRVERSLELLQMVCEEPVAARATEFERLGPDDAPAMLALAQRTEPGPFSLRSVEIGRFLGARRDGALLAMAGERFSPDGWIEVSAVCTDAAARGQGLASALTRAVTAGIQARGRAAFLHVMPSAPGGDALQRFYEHAGYRVRRTLPLAVLTRLAGAD